MSGYGSFRAGTIQTHNNMFLLILTKSTMLNSTGDITTVHDVTFLSRLSQQFQTVNVKQHYKN